MRDDGTPAPGASRGPGIRKCQPHPDHYKVICISLYNRDLEQLDGLVAELKARGVTKATRSALIRVALDQFGSRSGPSWTLIHHRTRRLDHERPPRARRVF
jgi:hypothetical protein